MKFLLDHPAEKPNEIARIAGKNYYLNKQMLFSTHHSCKVCFAYKAIGLLSSKTQPQIP
jgi:hypothetical protein